MNTNPNPLMPLEHEDYDVLERFLQARLDHIDAAIDDPEDERDTGVLVLSELDGFLCGLVCGPGEVPQSVWLGELWGDFAPGWAHETHVNEVLDLVSRHRHAIAHHLKVEPESFEPIFDETREGVTIVDEWCTGFARAVALNVDAWERGGDEVAEMLFPIFTFGLETGWEVRETLGEREEQALRDGVAPAMRLLHGYWSKNRHGAGGAATTDKPRVGRNAACPCGSGHKYKYCCMR